MAGPQTLAQALFLEQLASLLRPLVTRHAGGIASWRGSGGGPDGVDGTGVTSLAISSPPDLRFTNHRAIPAPTRSASAAMAHLRELRPRPRRRARWRIRSRDSLHAACVMSSRGHTVGRQGPGTCVASSSPGHGGIVIATMRRGESLSHLNWNSVSTGIVTQMPASRSTICSSSPSLRQIDPHPETTYQISSTVR